MHKVLPVLTELRPLPIEAKLFTDSKYKEFCDSIKERISFENRCRELYFPEITPKFDKIFKDYFPAFLIQNVLMKVFKIIQIHFLENALLIYIMLENAHQF